jgi:dTDP-4-amino-4,6-dideoxygalactose transaminase
LALKIIGDYTVFHLRRFYRGKYGNQQGDFPNAEWISDCMLPLPLTAKMTPGDAAYVVEEIQFILTQQGQ